MELTERAAYLKGLIEGLGIDETTKEGKIIKAMNELLGELSTAVMGLDEDLTQAYDLINDLNDEIEDLEADLYEEDEEQDSQDDDEDEDDDNEPFYEVACPNCGQTVYVSGDDLDVGEAICPSCKVAFEVALEEEEADQEEAEGPVQYEVTCPNCGSASVIEEETLLSGGVVCPSCGQPLDFEVTEEE